MTSFPSPKSLFRFLTPKEVKSVNNSEGQFRFVSLRATIVFTNMLRAITTGTESEK